MKDDRVNYVREESVFVIFFRRGISKVVDILEMENTNVCSAEDLIVKTILW